MSDAAPASPSGFWITAAAAVGGFLIFILILVVAYLPNKPASLPEGTKTPQERADILRDVRAKDTAAANSYGWIDRQNGVVRLPIERAMELTVQELNAKK
jgi:hypothetical protein